MKLNFFILVFVFFNVHGSLFSQTDFYDINTVREIKISFTQADWDAQLDAFYTADQGERLIGSVEIDGVAFDSVGIRYKGYSSASTTRVKNPFNIKLDYVIEGQNYNGIEKLKLSNVIQDPSFVRESLTYEIARKYMPASKANYANVYINNVLIGVYTNVESVEDDFLLNHFGSNDYTFIKGNPVDLDLTGENANLGNSPGTNVADYDSLYVLKSRAGWDKLYGLIDTLNNSPENIESVLNVDRTLWMHALNYSMINFDSYVGYAQNYYLYEDDNGQFNPILWDLNMSFASYRLADASIHYNGFTIQEAMEMDPLLHHNNISVYPRPLMRNLFDNDRYRKQYLAHIRTIMEENFDNGDYAVRGLAMQTVIDSDVAADTNKFYSYSDFQDNLNTTVSDFVDYPGITELMDARSTYLGTYPGMNNEPVINSVNASSTGITLGDDIYITAQVDSADTVILAYRYGTNAIFEKVYMLDDGTQNDGAAGDSLYGILLSGIGNNVQYYIYAENDSAGTFSPKRAAYEYYSIEGASIEPNQLVINELMSDNENTAMDEHEDYNDWIEIYNPTPYDISTKGLYLTDEYWTVDKWAMPDKVIKSNDYMIIWADEEPDESLLHTNFKLESGSGELMLTDGTSDFINWVDYPSMDADIAYGRYPNGTGPFADILPTFNGNNDYATSIEEGTATSFEAYPNPAREEINIRPTENGIFNIEISDINGRSVLSISGQYINEKMTLNVSEFANGFYVMQLNQDDQLLTKKFVINK